MVDWGFHRAKELLMTAYAPQYATDVDTGDRYSLQTARDYAKRIREDLRDFEAAVKTGDWDTAYEYAADASGAAAGIVAVVEAFQAKTGADDESADRWS
jgi:hypothetical protein